MRKFISIVFLTFFCFVAGKAQQDSAWVEYLPTLTYNFVPNELNTLQNVAGLKPFFAKLAQQKKDRNQLVRIVHLGDSHLQADFLTAVVREAFHTQFGNAGRGLVVPLRVAGTNEPLTFSSFSSTAWQSRRMVKNTPLLPIGIGGVTIQTNRPSAQLGIKVNNGMGLDYAFGSVQVFYKQDGAFDGKITDAAGNFLAEWKAANGYDGVQTIYLPQSVNEINLVADAANGGREWEFYGLNLENGYTGVLYHTVGVNGAKYKDYNLAEKFHSQLQQLYPDLVIISLGTNEAQQSIDPVTMRAEIDRLVQTIQLNNAGAQVLLTTPADSYWNKRESPYLPLMREVIVSYCMEKNLPYWDLFQIGGGRGSALNWKNNGLLSPDGVHYSRQGYAFQGQLLYNALIKAYQQYLLTR